MYSTYHVDWTSSHLLRTHAAASPMLQTTADGGSKRSTPRGWSGQLPPSQPGHSSRPGHASSTAKGSTTSGETTSDSGGSGETSASSYSGGSSGSGDTSSHSEAASDGDDQPLAQVAARVQRSVTPGSAEGMQRSAPPATVARASRSLTPGIGARVSGRPATPGSPQTAAVPMGNPASSCEMYAHALVSDAGLV